MYSVQISFGLIIFVLIVTSIIYGAQLFVIWTNQTILDMEITPLLYCLPLIIIFPFMILYLVAIKISEYFYSIVYIIFGTYLGYLLYTFLIAIPIRIILVFCKPPFYVSLILLYGLPLIICIYGIINALITKLVKINLKYPGFNGRYTILHLSDIHLGAIHQKGSVNRIVNEIRNLDERPDIVVITGDLADGSLKVKADWLSPFDSLEMPVLFITGNHEQLNNKKDMIKEVTKTNIKYIGDLQNFVHKGVNFIGVDFEYDIKEYLQDIKTEENMPNVILYHVPEVGPEELKEHNIFLLLAGHTHGGQIFPLNVAAYFTNKCFKGLYSDQGKNHHVYVSEGVNNAVVPMRVCSRRIFALITIEGEIEN